MDLPTEPARAIASLKDLLLSKTALLWAIPLLVFAVERFYWPLVASWREDEATVMWIGRHFSVTELTVGIVSSTGLPNPSGLLWLAKLLSYAPDLYWSGVFLQLLHLGALFAVCLLIARRVALGAGLTLFGLIGCLLAYRTTGSEPFSQWLMLPTMLVCTCLFLLCVQRPSFTLLFSVLGLLWLPPALYIAGVLNSAMFALSLGACVLNPGFRRSLLATEYRRPLLAFLLWSLAQLLLIWKPYFSVVSLSALKSVSATPLSERLQNSLFELLRAPVWLWEYACSADFRPSLNIDERIVSSPSFAYLGVAAQWLFRALIVAAVIVGVRVRLWQKRVEWLWVYWPLLLLLLALVLSPLLGGPRLSRGERPDIGFQFLSLLLIPMAVSLSSAELPQPARIGVLGLAFGFCAVEMAAGPISLTAHLRYHGDVLSNADVPLRQKMAVIDAIVSEAKLRNIGPEIPVDYVVDGIWKWIRRFKPKYLVRYGSPYTLGRAFDYDLERRYGITNALEGKRGRRPPSWGFWVNYAFEKPVPRGETLREIGRLRLGYQPKPAER
jgi:hypothetical protein